MRYTNLFKNISFFLLFLGLGLMYNPYNAAAFSKKPIDFESMKPVTLNAVIQDISVSGNYLIVGETKVYLIEFKLGSDKYRSVFVNSMNDTSDISALRVSLWKGKRVLVKGFQLANGNVMAGIIKMQPGQ